MSMSGRMCATAIIVAGAVCLTACAARPPVPSAALKNAEALYRPFSPAAQTALGVHLAPHRPGTPVRGLISVSAAIESAKARIGDVPASSVPTVTFGDFTDPLAQGTTVFVVTYGGLSLPPIATPRGQQPSHVVNHEESLVVDASSGAVIESFSYR